MTKSWELWDQRASGFRGVSRGPVLVLMFWLLVSIASVSLTLQMNGHEIETGLGLPLWTLIFSFLIMWYAVVLGVGWIYHRLLSHNACELHPIVLYPLLLSALPAGTPIQWVGNHRNHHVGTDREKDWHSPKVYGFWVSHAGWYIYNRNPWICALYTFAGPFRTLFDAFWRPQTNQEYVHLAKDVASVPFYNWISRPTPFAFFVIGHIAVTWCLSFLLWGTNALLPLFLLQVGYYAIGDGVNSILHMWGTRPFKANDESVNIPYIGFLAAGEGYHNAHHAFPRSLKAGLLPYEFDLIYVLGRGLERIGLCRKIQTVSTQKILERLEGDRYRAYFEKKLGEEKTLEEGRTR